MFKKNTSSLYNGLKNSLYNKQNRDTSCFATLSPIEYSIKCSAFTKFKKSIITVN